MPRVIWKGSVSFGLVTIPVQLYNAVSRKNVRCNQLDAQTGARVRHKRSLRENVRHACSRWRQTRRVS